VSAFLGLVAVIVGFTVWAVHRAAVVAGRDASLETQRVLTVWGLLLGVSGGLAVLGVLEDFSLPPKLPLLVFAVLALTIWLGASKYGAFLARSVPLWVLVGINAFRLPLEVLMNRAATEGVMPIQMSYSGQNYDVLTGVLAIVVGLACRIGDPPLRLVRIFNVVGLVLLINIVVIAVLSMPLPIRQYMNEPANTWIAYFPFVWLPVCLVSLAALTHILILRRLVSEISLARHEKQAAVPRG